MKPYLNILVFLYSLQFIEGGFRSDYYYDYASNTWFKSFSVPATWYDARLRCALEGATLASPSTPQMYSIMKKTLHNWFNPKLEVFTGIHATFSQGDYHTIEGTPLSDFSKAWSDNEPDNKDNKESCITFDYNGKLADRRCEATRPYICYRENKKGEEVSICDTLDPEYRFDQRTNHCYKFHTVPRTFKRANFACSAEGGHLVIINSETEAQVIRELFAKYGRRQMVGTFWKDVAFVGFSDWGEHGEWRTIHGQTLTEAGYNKFSPGEPNNSTTGEYCGSVYRTALLNDLWCENPYAFICEKNPFVRKTESKTSSNNDQESNQDESQKNMKIVSD